jgi:hypothetical protein
MVLHTWGQQLEHHPHVHCVVPGGGLAVPAKTAENAATDPGDQAPRWVSCRPNWFLSVKVLSPVFRGKYLAALRAAYQAGLLQFAGTTLPLANSTAWAAWIRALYQKNWVVYAKEPFGGPEQVLKYLTGYTHRVALSNHRLVKLRDDRVTFTWKDYADGCRRKEMTLAAVEFVRRFALHIIPKGLVRIRQYGLLAHRDRGERLALCRSLLTTQARSTTDQETNSPRPGPGDGSTAGDQTAKGVEPQAPLVDPKTTSPSPMTGFIVLLLVVLIATGDISSFILSPTEPPLVVIAQDYCPSCGVGRLRTIWQAARPGHEERQQIPILDSS